MVEARPYPLHKALLAQAVGLAALLLLVQGLVRFAQVDPAGVGLALAMVQGGIAAAVAIRQAAPAWWIGIHVAFGPLLYLVHRLDIAPGWFLLAFLLLLLVFWRTDRSRVPLYLSNRQTASAVAALLPTTPCCLLDIGCGDGGLLAHLARTRPDCRFVGIEHAPLPWLLARLRARRLANVRILYGNYWTLDLAGYDVVYAFLSPAPMPRLWEKAVAEMKPGAQLVSNSFTVPGVQAARLVKVGDRRKTRLYAYRPDKARDSAAFPDIPAATDPQ